MSLTLANKEDILESLIMMGRCGHFPLFPSNWISDGINRPMLTKKEGRRAKQILDRVLDHRSLDKRRTVIDALNDEDRNLFIRSFMQMVENRVIDARPTLQ